ncbi:MAG: peptide chain release factor N(5)-glutamine methyltransferase [Gammaproteobacteria bacterium]|nr:peptide chain release factor N(5)-glutamine methyltransferase [Gammaproteobacteria bacterium]
MSISIKLALQQAIEQLENSPSTSLDAEVLLCHVLQESRSYLFTWPERLLDHQQYTSYRSLLNRRAAGAPIAYIVGEREFWSLPFKVNQHTLIPRPETELLVESALQLGSYLSSQQAINVIDLGTGSGCIALSVAREKPDWQIQATDCSAEALQVARYNADRLGIGNVEFIQSNWFDALDTATQFDLVLANPPYIAEDAPHLYQGDVRFEPQSALVAGKDGLNAIRILVNESLLRLKKNGWIIFELGYDQADRVIDLVYNAGYNYILFKKDLAGIKRHCIAHRPG